VLAAAGIYGVMAHLVSVRTNEIGVRLALGASPRGVMRQVLSEALVQTTMGLAVGLGAAMVAMQGLRAMLYGVAPTDPITFAGVGVLFLAVTIARLTRPCLRRNSRGSQGLGLRPRGLAASLLVGLASLVGPRAIGQTLRGLILSFVSHVVSSAGGDLRPASMGIRRLLQGRASQHCGCAGLPS
jgi:ABC-type antimicrobial peptide transport system permease subunit